MSPVVRPSRPDPAYVSAHTRTGMISTSHLAATAAGVRALQAGGSAVDAYLAAAVVQTVVEPTMTSLAGTMLVSVFDPATRTSRIVGDMGGLPSEEDGRLQEHERWSGRMVMRPGWVLASDAASRRWGRLAWAELFTDAIAAARAGFEVDPLVWGWMFEARRVAGMYPPGRDIWFPDGHLVRLGDVLRQPALARTLEQLATQGPAYFYEGEFAQHYVDVAQSAGRPT